MRRKKLWNRTLAAVLGLAMIFGAPLVDLGNGQLLGGVAITVKAAENEITWDSSTKTLTMAGTVTYDSIDAWFDENSGFLGFGGTKKTDVQHIVCADKTVLPNIWVKDSNDQNGLFSQFTNLVSVDFTGANLTNVTSMDFAFKGCTKLTTVTWGNVDTSNVTRTEKMFMGCTSLVNVDMTGFDTNSLRDANSMFQNCTKLQTVDLSSWDTTQLSSTSHMFDGCTSLTTIVASETWQMSSVQYSASMFKGCTNLKGGNNTAYNSSNVGKAYACFDSEGAPGYLTYGGNLTKHDAVAETFTEDGNEEYWTSPNNGPEYQLVNGFFVKVNDHNSEVVIPQILIEPHHEEVPATPNSAGTVEYWEGTDGKNYVQGDVVGTFVEAEDLTIPKVQVTLVEAVPATWTEAGREAYYTDGNGHYYELVGEEYVEHPLDYFTTPALLGTHHDAQAVSPYNEGNDEYWESANEGMCYVSDGNGGYTEVALASVLHPAVGVAEVVSRKEPSYGEHGAGNVSYVIGADGNKYVLNESTGKFDLVENEADLVIPALKLAMKVDPVNSQSAVDILICVEMPEDANVDEYSLQFGAQVVPFSSSYSWTDPKDNTVYYLAKISSPAKDMATEYPYSIKKHEEVTYTGSQTISVRTYALTVINGNYDGDYTTEQKAALSSSCRAMLAYGSAAQTYKNYNTSHLADAGVSGVGSSYADVTLPTVEVFEKAQLNEALAAVEAPVLYNGMGLEMLADTHLNLAFRVQSGYTQEQAIAYISENFQIDGVAAVATPNTNANFVVVQTDALPIKNLFKDITLSFGTRTYVVNVAQYMSAANDGSEVLKNLCKALLNYYNFATATNN